VPFWTSYVVRSYAWSLVLAKGGVLNGWLTDMGLPPLDLANSLRSSLKEKSTDRDLADFVVAMARAMASRLACFEPEFAVQRPAGTSPRARLFEYAGARLGALSRRALRRGPRA
jgi:hypothetical protein